MVGVLASCNALEPIFETGDNVVRPKAELMQESVVIDLDVDMTPLETMSESPTVLVT